MFLELQQNIVIKIINKLDSDWDKITANIEIDEIDGETVVSPECFYAVNGQTDRFKAGFEALQLFKELRGNMSQGKEPWTICDLEINKDGTYNFKFSYDTPPRLSELR